MRLNNTFAALNNSIVNQKETNKSLNNLSSGLRINKASDDASGLAIADKLRTHASGIKQSIANANSAVALLQITDKAMDEISNILDIVKTKLIQAHTHTTSTKGRESIKKDIEKLLSQIDNISTQTKYNNTELFNHEGLDFQVGVTYKDTISLNEIDISLYNLSINRNETTYQQKDFREIVSIPVGGGYSLSEIHENSDDLKNVKSSDITNTDTYYLDSLYPLDLSIEINKDPLGYSSFGGGYYIPKDENTRDFFSKYVAYVNSKGTPWSATVHNSSELGEYYRIPDELQIDGSADSLLLKAQTLNFSTFSLGYDTSLPISKRIVNISNALINNSSTPRQYAQLDSNNVFEGKFNPTTINTANQMIYDLTYLEPVLGDCGTLEDLKTMPTENFTFQCAGEFQKTVDDALTNLNRYRSEVGSTQVQIESTNRNLMTNYVNTKNAESVIRDVDYAQESSNFTKLNIIGQAGSFAQTKQNETQQRVLELLK